MTKKGFSHPMYTSEKVFGWIYVVLHVFVMPFLLALGLRALARADIVISDRYFNLLYYGIGFILIFIFMHHYLKANFYDLCENKWNTVTAVTTGYLFYYLLGYLINLVVYTATGETSNPNNNAVIEAFLENKNIMFAVAAIMAPIVEEVLFRGVIFGTVRRKSRLWAYVVSVAAFAVYHLWSYLAFDYDPTLFIEMLQYLPGGIVLAWAYERGRNIWAPIVLHMIINFFALSVSVTFLG